MGIFKSESVMANFFIGAYDLKEAGAHDRDVFCTYNLGLELRCTKNSKDLRIELTQPHLIG